MACSTSTFSIGGSQPLGAMSARKLDFRNHRRSVNFDVDREGKHSAAGMRWCRMTQPFVVHRSPFRRRLARAATAVAVVCWLASIGLLIWAMRLDHAHFDDFSRFWEHVIRRNRFPTVPQVAAIDIGFTIFWLFAMAGLSFEKQRIQKEAMMGFCPQCGYDLFGNSSGICPECGRPIETYPQKTWGQPRW
jgi:hypothetical protein